MTHRATAIALDTWHQQAATQRRVTLVASKGVRRMLARTLAVSISRWQESTKALQRQRKVQAIVRVLHVCPNKTSNQVFS
jgi:hypothetical protein